MVLGCRDDKCCPHALRSHTTLKTLYTDYGGKNWGPFGFQPSLLFQVSDGGSQSKYTPICLQLLPDSGAKGLLLKGSKHRCDYHFDSQMLFIPFTLTSCWRPPPQTRSASLLPSATSRPAGKDQHGTAARVLARRLTYIHPPC